MAELPQVDLVGVGLNATDTLIPLPDYPSRGSKMEYRAASVMPGGQTATTVIACQTWGLRTRYVGKLGDDDAARLHEKAFERAGVEARLIKVAGGVSPQSLILVDGGGERTVLCRRDERMALKPEELDRAWIVNARALHVDGYDTAAATLAARWAHDAGIPVVADLDEIYPGVEELIENVDYMIVSRDFPCRLMRSQRRSQSGECSAPDALPLRMPAERSDSGAGRRAGLGRQAVAALRRLSRPRGRHHWRRRYFPRRVHLRIAAGLAAGADARFFLRGSGDELHGARRARRHSARGRHREH